MQRVYDHNRNRVLSRESLDRRSGHRKRRDRLDAMVAGHSILHFNTAVQGGSCALLDLGRHLQDQDRHMYTPSLVHPPMHDRAQAHEAAPPVVRLRPLGEGVRSVIVDLPTPRSIRVQVRGWHCKVHQHELHPRVLEGYQDSNFTHNGQDGVL
jgi:hypothetical protein